MLKTQDLLDIIKIGRTALECDQIDELRKEVIKLLAEAFHVERSNFFLSRQYPSPRLALDNIIGQGIEKKYLTLFQQHYYKIDPFLKTINASTAVVTTRNVVPLRDLIKSEYYNDFLKPQSIYYQMAIHLRSGGQLFGTLALFRSAHEEDFSPREKAKGEILASYLGGALEKATFRDKMTRSEQIINSICPDLPYKGILVLDESLGKVYINEEAGKTLASLAEEKELWENSLFPLPKELYAQCQKLTESSKLKEDAAPREVKILDKRGHTISANLRMINYSRDSRMCLICMNQNGSGMLLSAHLDKFGITRRELEVISLVCEGLKNREIGEKLFISEYTVENHLRSIYEKLGVKNRTSMAHKAMHSLP